MQVGQRVRIKGKAVTGTQGAYGSDTVTEISTHIYSVCETGRGWDKVLAYFADSESLTGTVVSVEAAPGSKSQAHVMIQLDAECADITTGDWSVKPYKRKNGTFSPNTYMGVFKHPTIGSVGVYGLNLRMPLAFSIRRNEFEIISE